MVDELFINQKKVFLSKKDKSKKGSIDIQIKPLIDLINSFDSYYTTSSCAGRIIIMAVPKSGKKNMVKWLFVSHEKIDYNDIKDVLVNLPKETVWFRQEPAILHVCCYSIDDAKRLIDIARSVGFKKSGIQSTRKIVVELTSPECINVPISKNGNLLIDENYFNVLIDESNKKLDKTRERIKRFIEKLKEIKD